jgi:hypothetical protein
MANLIDSSFESLDINNLVPSFFEWLFGGALSMENGSIFGIALLLTVAMVSFLAFKGFRYDKAILPSSFITWLIGLLALKAGWINNTIFFLTCIYVVVGFYYVFKESSGEEA